MIFLYILLFIASCFLLAWAGFKLVESLSRIAEVLRWREFVVAFVIMASACSLPNLFVGINSALKDIPQLSFGDIVGGNVINLTVAVGLAVLAGKGNLLAKSRMVQSSAFFCLFTAVLPLFLAFDGVLGRSDALILILVFIIYVFWLFSKDERFKKAYDDANIETSFNFLGLFKDIAKIILFLSFLLLSANGIVISAHSFSGFLKISLPLVGILIVGLGDSLPEIYFGVISSAKRKNWLILGDLIGSVIITGTLVLGIVALISPIKVVDFNSLLVARIFLIISALFFLIAIRTGQKITKKEALFLLLIYFIFIIAELFVK